MTKPLDLSFLAGPRRTRPGSVARDSIARRMEAIGTVLGHEGNAELPKDPWAPRWRIDAKVIEFECGCRGERTNVDPAVFAAWDPVIFRGQPEQALYDFVCQRHMPGMNKYVHFGKFADFEQWKRARRAVLLGKVRP